MILLYSGEEKWFAIHHVLRNDSPLQQMYRDNFRYQLHAYTSSLFESMPIHRYYIYHFHVIRFEIKCTQQFEYFLYNAWLFNVSVSIMTKIVKQVIVIKFKLMMKKLYPYRYEKINKYIFYAHNIISSAGFGKTKLYLVRLTSSFGYS